MTTTEHTATTTLNQLHTDPTTPVPMLVGGQPTHTDTLPAAHADRLVQWAAISGWSPHTTVEITGTLGPTDRPHYSPHATPLARPVGYDVRVTGWTLRLTPPGHDAHDVHLTMDGHVIDHGTRAEQDARWRQHADRKSKRAAEERAEDGHALLDAVARTTRARSAAQATMAEAEQEWRDAIQSALAGRASVAEVARLAKISRERVYQIRDGRR